MKDQAMLMQWINKWNVDINEEAYDINSDGKVNMKDYALLQQLINGWSVLK